MFKVQFKDFSKNWPHFRFHTLQAALQARHGAHAEHGAERLQAVNPPRAAEPGENAKRFEYQEVDFQGVKNQDE